GPAHARPRLSWKLRLFIQPQRATRPSVAVSSPGTGEVAQVRSRRVDGGGVVPNPRRVPTTSRRFPRSQAHPRRNLTIRRHYVLVLFMNMQPQDRAEALLAELAELDMTLARHVHACAIAAEEPKAVG